jgi:hypothetical protein
MYDNVDDLSYKSREADVVLNDGHLEFRQKMPSGKIEPKMVDTLEIIPLKSLLVRMHYKNAWQPGIAQAPDCMAYGESMARISKPSNPSNLSCNQCALFTKCNPSRILLAFIKPPNEKNWSRNDTREALWIKIPRTGIASYADFCNDYVANNRTPGTVELYLAVPRVSKTGRRSMAFRYNEALPSGVVDSILQPAMIETNYNEMVKHFNQMHSTTYTEVDDPEEIPGDYNAPGATIAEHLWSVEVVKAPGAQTAQRPLALFEDVMDLAKEVKNAPTNLRVPAQEETDPLADLFADKHL